MKRFVLLTALTLAAAILAAAPASAQSLRTTTQERALRHYQSSPAPVKSTTATEPGRVWVYVTPAEAARLIRTPVSTPSVYERARLTRVPVYSPPVRAPRVERWSNPPHYAGTVYRHPTYLSTHERYAPGNFYGIVPYDG